MESFECVSIIGSVRLGEPTGKPKIHPWRVRSARRSFVWLGLKLTGNSSVASSVRVCRKLDAAPTELVKTFRVWVGPLELRKSHGKDLFHHHLSLAIFLDYDELLTVWYARRNHHFAARFQLLD